MTLEVASYIAGIIAAVAGIGSLHYAREQHKKQKPSSDIHIAVPKAPVLISQTAQETTPVPVVEFASEGIPSEFLIAFETTKGMFNKPARDTALKALVQKALAANSTEFAIAVASEIWNKPTKDDVLTTIVQHALRSNDFQLAYHASELFFNMPKKDQAKELIINCVGNAKA
ncbi:hypothetical protein [Methylogaea oryzae]|uniref:Uncharacterized protein n=1 Tax=Methylogaea oryzae TaxID=1295382 RepID=A0A8D4VPA6_9GAMM|nr:hypothetical protein [Methylogaea oryzae]BBL71568.1 hypothetical protein MoryE10_21740 [Methylogaea oryzae]